MDELSLLNPVVVFLGWKVITVVVNEGFAFTLMMYLA
jgi:hypothetical protein